MSGNGGYAHHSGPQQSRSQSRSRSQTQQPSHQQQQQQQQSSSYTSYRSDYAQQHHSDASDPYQSRARTQYGPYDPRYPYGHPSSAASNSSPAAPASTTQPASYAHQTSHDTSHAASYHLPEQYQQMSLSQDSAYDPTTSSRSHHSASRSQQQQSDTAYAQYEPSDYRSYPDPAQYTTSSYSRAGQRRPTNDTIPGTHTVEAAEPRRMQDDLLTDLHQNVAIQHPQASPALPPKPVTVADEQLYYSGTAHREAETHQSHFDPEAYRSLNRPVSSSASGIISLYTEDSYPTHPSAPSSTTATSMSTQHFPSVGDSKDRYGLDRSTSSSSYAHSSSRVPRPLPTTPATQQDPPAYAPSAAMPTMYESTPTGHPEHDAYDDFGPARAHSPNPNSYFTAVSPQPSSGQSQPTTPSATHHSTASSISSRNYPAPSWSPSASVRGTPGSPYSHRPLPSTASNATSLDRSFSPPPRESSNASPISTFRSPSQSHAQSRPGLSASRTPSASIARNQSLQGSGGQRTTSASFASPRPPQDSAYDPNSYSAQTSSLSPHNQSSRQRTQSDATGLSYQPSKTRRQPLPPVPNLPSMENGMLQMPTVNQRTPSNSSDIYGNGGYPPSLASQSSFSNLTSQAAAAAPRRAVRQDPYSVDHLTGGPSSAIRGDSQLHNPHARQDSLAWEPVNGLAQLSKQRLTSAPRSRLSHQRVPSDTTQIDWSLLSTVALLLRAVVPRGTQIKGSIDYPSSFTGKDVVSTLQDLLTSGLAGSHLAIVEVGQEDGIRQVALRLGKSLKSQLFFHEVDWGENELTDGVDEVYTFLEDSLAGPGASNIDPDDWSSSLNFDKALQSSLQLSVGGGDGSGSNHDRGKKPLTSATSAADLDELPTGVFTPLTRCYSPLCNLSGPEGCYSPSCPKSRESPLKDMVSGLSRKTTQSGSKSIAASQGVDQTHKKAWAELVAPELLKSIPEAEIARQNAILETIQKEEEFLADLELLDSLFVKGLQKPSDAGDPPPLPIGPERDHFIREVFGNHLELAAHIRVLVERLHIRQREENPIVQTIGDIFLSTALDWGETYVAYLVNYPLAISRVKREISVNPRFKAFVEACRRHPAAHKHPLENFLFRPPARLQRYHLHLESILKKTEEGNQDRENLQHAIEIINDQCKTSQAGVEAAELKVKIRDYAYNLAAKRNKSVIDMDLLNPERQLVHQGRVLRKPDAFDFDWTELLAILFDNYFVVVKPKRAADGSADDDAANSSSSSASASRFVLAKRPIPLEMLEISGLSDASISRSIGLSNFHISRERDARDFWPFTVSHIGGRVEPMTLFAPSKEARAEWKRKLDEAVALRVAIQNSSMVFEQQILSEDVFAIAPTMSLEPDRPVPGVDTSVFHGRVTCAVPFITADGRRLVAVGCSDGVWIGLRNDPKSLRKVLHLKSVTQCAVLESFGIFVVLADKVLISYSLEALVPTTNNNASTLRPPQKLSGNRDVLFFNVGVLKDRTLLIYMKKKAHESVFRALEPVINAPRSNENKSGSGFFGKFGKDSKSTDWFRIYKTFFIPSEAYSIQFLKSKLCIICAKGFEIMNLDSLLPGTIPDFAHAPRDDPRILQLQKRVETAKPLGMFKTCDNEFLLCYDAFACYVDRLGEPIRMEQVIEWEGFPKQVAFSGNYVLAFDPRFVEVRDAQSGQLVQIIRGSDLRYISGSSTISASSSETALLSALDADINPVIFTKRERAPTTATRFPYDFQRVVELSPMGPNPLSVSAHAHAQAQANVGSVYSPPFTRSATVASSSSRGSGPRPSFSNGPTPSTTPAGWI